MQLDSLDVEILKLVQEDGRMMYKDIGKKLGVSIPTVKSRITKLMELGVIKKFTAIVDPDKITGKTRAIFLFKIDARNLDNIREKLSKIEEVREIYLAAGNFSLVAKLEVKDTKDLSSLTAKQISTIEGILDISCLVITDVVKEEYGGLVEPNMLINFKCVFCHVPISGAPYVEYINGGRYYFSSKECAEAYKQKILAKNQS